MRVDGCRAPVAVPEKPANGGQSDAVDEALRCPGVTAVVDADTRQPRLLPKLAPEPIDIIAGEVVRKDLDSIGIAGQPIYQLCCIRAEPDRAGSGLRIGQSGC